MTDATKDTIPRKGWHELAEDLLAKFPGIDRADLLKELIATYFVDLTYGNKREERAAYDLLNTVRRLAIRNAKDKGLIP